jgi:branched-chain amino acid transport system substrate-binding protein
LSKEVHIISPVMEKTIKQFMACICTICILFFTCAASIDGSSIQNDSPKKVVGVIIPLSGKWGSVGQKILKGIEMAANVFTAGQTPDVEYVIRDYGNNEESIPKIIDELDREYKVAAIIGPLGERASDITYREVQARHLPTIMFTQAEMTLQPNAYCFRNFVTVDIQAKALLGAARSMGITRFAVMSPDDRFGKTFSDAFIKMAPKYNIKVLRTITYAPQNGDFNQQVKALLASRKKIPSEKSADIKAILIPDSASNAAMIASYLYPKIPNARLFGPMLWDTPEFMKVGDKYVENAVFLSGFFHASIISSVQNFNQSFTSTFKYAPSIWEASAFDTASILQNILQSQTLSRSDLRERIADVKAYPGVSGITTFSANGSLDKEIYILTIRGGSIYEFHP